VAKREAQSCLYLCVKHRHRGWNDAVCFLTLKTVSCVIAVAGFIRPHHSTGLPVLREEPKRFDGTTALAGAAAPRTRYTEYDNTVPLQGAFSAQLTERPAETTHGGLCVRCVGRNRVGALSDA
jgi:hypothetical protein